MFNEWLRLRSEIVFQFIYNEANIFSIDYEGKERQGEARRDPNPCQSGITLKWQLKFQNIAELTIEVI